MMADRAPLGAIFHELVMAHGAAWTAVFAQVRQAADRGDIDAARALYGQLEEHNRMRVMYATARNAFGVCA